MFAFNKLKKTRSPTSSVSLDYGREIKSKVVISGDCLILDFKLVC